MMGERKYSIAEIDRMRSAIRSMCIQPGVPFYAVEKTVEIEERLRTYMLNGTEPDELGRVANETRRVHRELFEQMHAPADPESGDGRKR